MRVLIIEDEEPAYKNLSGMLQHIDGNIQIAGWIRSIQKALDWFERNEEPDLIFLDIKLTDGISFEIFERLDISSPVIFTTAYSEYAVKAFEINGVDYLLKPFNRDRLKQSIDKFIRYHSGDRSYHLKEIIRLIKDGKTEDLFKSRFLVKIGDKLKTVLTSEIVYFYRDELVWIVTRENKKYPVDYSLDDLEELLNPKYFFRINRQYIVHVHAVVQVLKYFKGKLKVILTPDVNGDLIISQERASKFKAWMDGVVGV